MGALNMLKLGVEQITADDATKALQGLIKVDREQEALFKYYGETGTNLYGTQYSNFGPKLVKFAESINLDDLYFVNANGLVVFSALTGPELATNLIDGPFSKSPLGEINSKVAEKALAAASVSDPQNVNGFESEITSAEEPTTNIIFQDFQRYAPAENEPTAFLGLAVTNANQDFIGSIIAQIPKKKISEILNNQTGLGSTGETILTNTSGLVLLNSTKTKEDDALNTKIDFSRFAKVRDREVVTGTLDKYRNMSSLVSLAKVQFGSAEWIVAGIVSQDEVLAGTLKMGIGIVTVSVLTLLAALAFAFWFARSLTRPITAIIAHMHELIAGNTSFDPEGKTRKDEVGDIVRSVESFRQAAIEKVRLEEEALTTRLESEIARAANEQEKQQTSDQLSSTVDQLARGLETLAAGNLVNTLESPFMESMEPVRHNYNVSIAKLRSALEGIDLGASSIKNVSYEISAASSDLSDRTEKQAASLEEAAAAVQELTDNVRTASDQAQRAAKLAKSAKEDTDQSAIVVSNAMSAMSRIEQASNDIGGIINVIDEIAFQTNLLALNAGVEAARAGEAGQGFAVVAQEVRELAGSSAEAAKEIKALIDTSNDEVGQGVDLVNETGTVLDKISKNVSNIEGHITHVASQAAEQLESIETVNSSVTDLDQRIQQNAAMAEETTAATFSLVEEINGLAKMVGTFDIGDGVENQLSGRKLKLKAQQMRAS